MHRHASVSLHATSPRTRQGIGRIDKAPVLPHRGTKYLRERNVKKHMYAVLPWQSASLDACYQEPDCSSGGQCPNCLSLEAVQLAPNRIVGYVRSPMGALGGSSTRVSSGSKDSIPACVTHVNRVYCSYDKTNNDAVQSARQTTHRAYQGTLRLPIGYCGYSPCFENGCNGRDCSLPCPTPKGTPHSSPAINGRGAPRGGSGDARLL